MTPSHYYAPVGEVSAVFLLGRFLGPRVPAFLLRWCGICHGSNSPATTSSTCGHPCSLPTALTVCRCGQSGSSDCITGSDSRSTIPLNGSVILAGYRVHG